MTGLRLDLVAAVDEVCRAVSSPMYHVRISSGTVHWGRIFYESSVWIIFYPLSNRLFEKCLRLLFKKNMYRYIKRKATSGKILPHCCLVSSSFSNTLICLQFHVWWHSVAMVLKKRVPILNHEIFLLKISYDDRVGQWWLKVIINPFLHELLVALSFSLPKVARTGQKRKCVAYIGRAIGLKSAKPE